MPPLTRDQTDLHLHLLADGRETPQITVRLNMLPHGKDKSLTLTCKQTAPSHANFQVTPVIVLASLSKQVPRDAHDS